MHVREGSVPPAYRAPRFRSRARKMSSATPSCGRVAAATSTL